MGGRADAPADVGIPHHAVVHRVEPATLADAGASGNLSGVWDFQGPLVAREDGLLRSLAGPVPFGVLLGTWGVSLVLTQLMYLVNASVRVQA